MSGEIETVGALTTATLAADALQAPAASSQPTAEGARCLNCGAPLTGPFCGQCGQHAHLHRSIGDVVHEVLHGITHFDGRFWKTLPMLLFRPGRLTRSYIEGQRARYIAPVPLFLMVVFFMFFALSFVSWNDTGVTVNAGTGDAQRDTEQVAQTLAEIDRDLAAAQAAGSTQAAAALQAARRVVAGGTAQPGTRADLGKGAGVGVGDRIGEEIATAAARGDFKINLGSDERNEKARQALMNPKLVLYKLQTRAYKLSFLLVPLSLPWLWLAFAWKRDATLYDHVIFTLYSISFVSLIFVLASTLLSLGVATPWVWVPLLLAPVAHMFAQLRSAYGLRWWSATWRTLYMMTAAFLTLALYLIVMVVLGVLD